MVRVIVYMYAGPRKKEGVGQLSSGGREGSAQLRMAGGVSSAQEGGRGQLSSGAGVRKHRKRRKPLPGQFTFSRTIVT